MIKSFISNSKSNSDLITLIRIHLTTKLTIKAEIRICHRFLWTEQYKVNTNFDHDLISSERSAHKFLISRCEHECSFLRNWYKYIKKI